MQTHILNTSPVSILKVGLLVSAMFVSVCYFTPSHAQSTYNTPLGTPDGKIQVVIPEGTVVTPTYVPNTARDVTSGPTDLFNPQNIHFLSGGIGADEQLRLKNAEPEYSTKVTFAVEDGSFISDVQVDIKDAKGTDILSLLTDGPILLLDLKPGSYTLTASDGVNIKENKFTLKSKTAFAIHFPPK